MNKDLIKYAVLGIGAWYVWKTYMSGPSTPIVSTGGGGTTGGTTGGTVYNPPPPPGTNVQPAPPPPTSTQTAATLRSKLVAAAGGKTSGLNFDQWNYYLVAAYPGPYSTAPAPEDVGITRTDPMPQITVDQYVAAIMQWAGGRALAGLGPWGMGDLAELGLWRSHMPTQGWSGVERNPHFVWRT